MRVVSGMRPTGALHLGHLYGVLQQWGALQSEADACYFFVADWHALTTDYREPGRISERSVEMVRDWIAAGLDPDRAVLFRQSRVKAHAELHLLLSMITPVPWLERVPSYKDLKQNLQDRDLNTYGFLGYPLLQAADVTAYRGDVVPVGEDQLAHLELAREVVRRFHHFYGDGIFPEPKPRLTEAPRVPGTDGRKMSKSFDNAIYLSDDAETVTRKVGVMVTDPARVRRSDPGNPEVCDVFSLHKLATDPDDVRRIDRECRSAELGCVECKRILASSLDAKLAPLRERRTQTSPDAAAMFLRDGEARAREEAEATMDSVRSAVGLPET